MRISEVAARTGSTSKTIRYYEDRGLLPVAERTPAGYRVYGDDAIDRLGFIRSAQMVGLTLAEIRGIIEIRDNGGPPCSHVMTLVRRRADEIDEQIRGLRAMKRTLNELVAKGSHLDPADCDGSSVCQIITR